MKVKDIDKLREKLHNDKREAFSKFQVWLMLSEHNTEVPTVDAVPMSVIEEIKAEIRHFMFEVNPSSSESDYACNYILDLIDKKMGKEGAE